MEEIKRNSVKVSGVEGVADLEALANKLEIVAVPREALPEVKSGANDKTVKVGDSIVTVKDGEYHLGIALRHLSMVKWLNEEGLLLTLAEDQGTDITGTATEADEGVTNIPVTEDEEVDVPTVEEDDSFFAKIGEKLSELGLEIDVDKEKFNQVLNAAGGKAADVVEKVKTLDPVDKVKSAAVKAKGYVTSPDEILDDLVALGLRVRKRRRENRKD